MRAENYMMFRKLVQPQDDLSKLQLNLPPVAIHSVRIKDNSYVKDKSLDDIDFFNTFNITPLAIIRDTRIISNPPPANTTGNRRYFGVHGYIGTN